MQIKFYIYELREFNTTELREFNTIELCVNTYELPRLILLIDQHTNEIRGVDKGGGVRFARKSL